MMMHRAQTADATKFEPRESDNQKIKDLQRFDTKESAAAPKNQRVSFDSVVPNPGGSMSFQIGSR